MWGTTNSHPPLSLVKYLFYTYGKIIPHMLTQHEDVVKQIIFDDNTPINTVLNDVEELVNIATAALNP